MGNWCVGNCSTYFTTSNRLKNGSLFGVIAAGSPLTECEWYVADHPHPPACPLQGYSPELFDGKLVRGQLKHLFYYE